MEKWLRDAKKQAQSEAECFVQDMQYIAEQNNIEPEWFIEEVVKNIHKIMDTYNK
ncbi:MAG: hypothetical protein K6G87_18245 [Butyrivibrio sp.]|uniref:hypothetical protein n=1 Tax=Butyrivibrio sp. TaxID=28121 RepID=UPI0025CDC483|nr:hypothetical protein [Butyrivibrio sp.]MCR5773166.1 hypothetical protein [Butyrivibrio sp.]